MDQIKGSLKLAARGGGGANINQECKRDERLQTNSMANKDDPE